MKTLKTIILLASVFTINALVAQPGCTDPLATNYNPLATQNDGSCVYAAATVSAASSVNLPAIMEGTSGLIFWDNRLWTHNDDTDINLYAFDANAVNLYTTYSLTGTVNIDWEEISQDDDYVYIGDFGNNANGNRTNLKILRIEKNSLLQNTPIIDTISFAYANQTDFSPTGGNNTDFDCEAFIVSGDSIYLFTKQWVNQKTALYVLPKFPGNYMAQYKASLDVQGLITGSVYKENDKLIVLCGYSSFLQPFVYLLYDFNNTDFFEANKRKINLNLLMHQVEGITTDDGLTYYLTNEKFVYQSNIVDPKLHTFDLGIYLSNYLHGSGVSTDTQIGNDAFIYPNPAENTIYLESNYSKQKEYSVYDFHNRLVISGKINDTRIAIDVSMLSAGVYFLYTGTESFRFVKY